MSACFDFQIGETLSRFGIQEGGKTLLVARFNATPEELVSIRGFIKGTEVPLSELQSIANIAAIRKQYKIVDEELAVGTIGGAIVSRIAARDSG